MPGDDEVENRIPQELEALVVGSRRAAMSQGRDEQLRITRLIAELLAYPTDGPVRPVHVQCKSILVAAFAPDPDRLVEADEYKDVREQRRLVVIGGIDDPCLAVARDLQIFYVGKIHALDVQVFF